MAVKTPKREAELEEAIAALDTLAAGAQTANQFAAAVSARSRAVSLRADLARLREERTTSRIRDPLQRVRRLRRSAAADGSWVAASKLLDREHELEDAARRAKEDAAREALAGVGEDALVEMIAQAAANLPPPVRARLIEILGGG